VAAVSVHGAAAVAGAAEIGRVVEETQSAPIQAEFWEAHEVDLEPPEPAAPPERLPGAEDTDPEPATSQQRDTVNAKPSTSVEPPAAAAQAGRVLTAEPAPEEPLDLTGEGFVSGDSDRFAGGVTASRGMSEAAVRDRSARGDGVIGGTGRPSAEVAQPRPPIQRGADRSRPALPKSTNWSCGFPAAANAAGVDFARVRLVVTVGLDGRARSVAVQSDPGDGFGEQARRCAYGRSYQTAHDSSGRPVTRTTPPFWVTFTR
jgi:protein TonB